MKIHQRHHLRDKSLLNFNFLAVSLLASAPSPTKSLKGVEPKQDTDIHTPSINFIMFFHQQGNFSNILYWYHISIVHSHWDTFQIRNIMNWHATDSTVSSKLMIWPQNFHSLAIWTWCIFQSLNSYHNNMILFWVLYCCKTLCYFTSWQYFRIFQYP